MVELKSIEQLLYFMKGHIHLSRYDEKFIENVSTLIKVTTNQVVLLHTLILKYRRQFVKHELDVDKLVNLPWNITVIESSPQFTDGYITIENNLISFRSPFNKNFISEFRKQEINPFLWDKDRRIYEAPYGTNALKLLVNIAAKYYKNIHFCPITSSLLDSVKEYFDVKYWNPTLVNINGMLMIAAANEPLMNALSNIELNTDPRTLSILSWYGVNISDDITKDNSKLQFAGSYHANVEITNYYDLVQWLKELQCDCVKMSSVNVSMGHRSNLVKELEANNIPIDNSSDDTKYKFPVEIRFRHTAINTNTTRNIRKIIQMVNSEAITVK